MSSIPSGGGTGSAIGAQAALDQIEAKKLADLVDKTKKGAENDKAVAMAGLVKGIRYP
ncbi:hypothetical protein HF257_25970 [Pseudomonas sp. WS 5106]|uniref:Uncharacterized protein n=1 Tax=Pseudomonas cremoris TaxID=2724178 RepID=A0A7X1AS89_9PSED|nr:hypothetical protein [Pseudomonas cremoris]MBC2382279.1 hypothetical protein [Pseudomonas cremoris]MBC2409467.1 hypothetical protein [Pseudomonas cremoris]